MKTPETTDNKTTSPKICKTIKKITTFAACALLLGASPLAPAYAGDWDDRGWQQRHEDDPQDRGERADHADHRGHSLKKPKYWDHASYKNYIITIRCAGGPKIYEVKRRVTGGPYVDIMNTRTGVFFIKQESCR